MNKSLLTLTLLFIFLFIITLTHYYSEEKVGSTSEVHADGEEGDKLKNIGEAMLQEFEKTKDPKLNAVPSERLLQAYQVMKQRQSEKAAIPGLIWEERGPSNVAGRTRSIWIDKNNTNRVLAASVGGGLWETNNFSGNRNWFPQDDLFPNLAITTIAQQGNTDIMYFGTGEGWFNTDAIKGMGIWKSTDRGNTWIQLANTNNSTFGYVQKIVVTATGVVYAATKDDGLQCSVDGGKNWTNVLGAGERGADIEMGSDGTIYASLGINNAGSVWRSTLGTAGSWTNITPAGSYRRIEIATAPSNSNRVYVLCQNGGNSSVGYVGRSDNQGANWTSLSIPKIIDQNLDPANYPDFTRGRQAWYDLIAKVHPDDADMLIVGGIDAVRTMDGGDTWTQISTWALYAANQLGYTSAQLVHADHHEIVFFPEGNTNRAIFGTDGGLFYSEDIQKTNGFPSFTGVNLGYNVTQFYACALHPTDDYMLAGAQDNGSHQFSSSGVNATREVSGGDGAFCHIDQDNPSIQITSYTNNDYYLSTNGGVTFPSSLNVTRTVDGEEVSTGSFINPTDYDNDANKLYGGYGTNQFMRWNNPGSGLSSDVVTVPQFNGAIITHVMTSQHEDNRVYFGLSNGTIVQVDNAHTGTNIVGTILSPGSIGSISAVALSDFDSQYMLATYSNYGVVSVYVSVNAGMSWFSVEGNLPDMPVRWAIFNPRDKDQALLATELGVWSTNDLAGSTTNWTPTNSNLANVRVDMLQCRGGSDDLILAATHGRGLFTTVVPFELFNYVSFDNTQTQVDETAEEIYNGCNTIASRKAINIPIRKSNGGDLNNHVTVSIDPASTAINGVDFELNTTSLSFNNLVENIVIYILDDAVLEEEETIILNVEIVTGDLKEGVLMQHTVTIKDDDADPVPQVQQLIWEEDWESGSANWLTDNPSSNGHNLWSIQSTSCDNLVENTTALIANKNTEGGFFCGYGSYNEQSHIWREANAFGLGDLHVTFDWLATGEIVNGTIYDFGTLVYSTNTTTPSWVEVANAPKLYESNGIQTTAVNLPDVLNGTTFLLGWRWQSDGSVVNVPALGFDNIRLTGVGTKQVVDTYYEKKSYLKNGQTAHFYNEDGSRIMASIKQTGGNADIGCVSISINYIGNGKRTVQGIGEVSEKSFFVQGNNDAPYELTLYYSNEELATAWVGEQLNLNLVKTSSTVPEAENPQIILNSNLTTNTYGSTGNFRYIYQGNSFGGFALTAVEEALAIDLLEFTAKTQSKGIDLNWTTLSETQNDYFLLERSADNVNFAPLTKVVTKGSASNEQAYYFLDEKPLTGRNYYRLTAIDDAGKSGKATLAVAEFFRAAALTVFPNPITQGNLTLGLDIAQAGSVSVAVMDITGKLIQQQQFFLQKGSHRLSIAVEQLSAGTYLLRVNDGVEERVERFVKH